MQPIIDEILTILQAEPILTAKITTFYDGLVDIPPKEYLPALMVDGLSTQSEAKSTAKDQYTYQIIIRLSINRAEFFDEAGSINRISSKRELRDIIEGREVDGNLKIGTVLYQVRKNVRGVQYLYNNDISIGYNDEKDARGKFMYATADMVFNVVTDLLIRP